MGLIQNLIRRMREKKEREKDFESDQHIAERYAEKKLSANERELIAFREQARQRRIKAELSLYRKRMRDDIWQGKKGNPAYAPNVVAGHKNLFNGKMDLLNDRGFLKQPNMFARK